MNNPFLIGKRVYLRPLNLNDRYTHWFNDAEVCAGNSHHIFPHTEAMTYDYIASTMAAPDKLVLAIIVTKGDKHIGNIALQNINFLHRNAEFTIIIGEKKCWGQGYAREAGDLLVMHGFGTLNLKRIYCGTFAENTAMRELAEYLGMQEEGVRKKAFYKSGKFVNIIEYGMVK